MASIVGHPKRSDMRADQKIPKCAPASDPESTACGVHQGLKFKRQVPEPKSNRENQSTACLDDCGWKSSCRGLFQLPMAA